MKYPKYLFITYCLYESQWWAAQMDEEVADLMKCSPEDRAEVLQFSFTALHFPTYSTENVSHIILDGEPGLVCMTVYMASSTGPFLAFQSCTLKKMKSWE